MKILLRESDGKTMAFHPESGESITKIENPGVWCDSSSCRTNGYPDEHAAGIYWNSMEEAREQLLQHEIVID